MIGTTVEHYRITERLGGGGMGEVYRAVDLELDREVAIKCVRADLADIKDVTRRFRAEARTLAKLSHPNIATVFRFFALEQQLFLVMEFIAGAHFGSVLRQNGSLPHARAVYLVRQALAGLGYAHGQKVVHRDIKPANLMVDGAGTVKVLDFGIAHLLDTTRMTRTGGVLGTPAYMAPEQALGKQVDARTDIYSLGIVLYEMLTGDLPFQANSDFELMRAHVEAEPRALVELSPSVPPGLQNTVMTALAKDSAERFQTAEEFSDALRAHLDDSTKVSVPVTPPPHTDVSATVAARALATTLMRTATSPRTRSALVGAGLALALAAGVWLLWGGEDPAVTGAEVTSVTPDSTGAAANPPGAGAQGAGAQGAGAQGAGAESAGAPGTASDTGASDPALAQPGVTSPAPAVIAQPASAGATGSSDPARAGASGAGQTGAATTASSNLEPASATPAPRRASTPATTASLPAAAKPVVREPVAALPPSVRVRKISVHERQGTGRFSRAAGYNGDFDLRVPSGGVTTLQIDEFIEVSRNGEQVLREFVTSAEHRPGTFESKQRVQALKQLDPGIYDVRLVFVAENRTLGSHDWQLEVVD